MKRAATHLFKRQSKNRAFFRNYRTSSGGGSGLELTDTVLMHYASLFFSFKYLVYHQAHTDSKHIHHICPIKSIFFYSEEKNVSFRT